MVVGKKRAKPTRPLPTISVPAKGPALSHERGWRWAFRLVCLFFAMNSAYGAIARYDPRKEFFFDSGGYVDQYRGKPLMEIAKPLRYRVLIPYLAAKIPFLPPIVTKYYYNIDENKEIAFRFGVLNGLGTAVTAMLLMAFMENLGFSLWGAAVGALFFLTSHEALINGGAMFVDPWNYAALVGCLLMAQGGSVLGLGLVFAVALFGKETIVVALPMVYLLGHPRRGFQIALMLLGLLPYLYFRAVLFPGGAGLELGPDLMRASIAESFHLSYALYTAMEFVLNFHLLAPLAWFGRQEAVGRLRVLRRLAWLFIPLAIGPRLVLCEYSRVWQLGFPIFIPLAVLGVLALLKRYPLASFELLKPAAQS
jgi:hypothetical protein